LAESEQPLVDVELGIIGGSGLYAVPGLEDVEEQDVSTPFGRPSDRVVTGRLRGIGVAFIPRHGRNHTFLPSEVPYRANICALKQLGVRRVLGVSAVGSLREDYAPLDVVIPDQLYDRTKARAGTFFGEGMVAHVGFAQPFCPAFAATLLESARRSPATTHQGGTLVVMEGPAFSTIAESETYRKAGFSLIGMTTLPEAKLAREAELCYASLSMVTDYDVWHQTHETVSSDMVAETLRRNIDVAYGILGDLVDRLGEIGECRCGSALASALLTRFDVAPEATLQRLRPIIGRYTDGAH